MKNVSNIVGSTKENIFFVHVITITVILSICLSTLSIFEKKNTYSVTHETVTDGVT
jgi:hypothetical protein